MQRKWEIHQSRCSACLYTARPYRGRFLLGHYGRRGPRSASNTTAYRWEVRPDSAVTLMVGTFAALAANPKLSHAENCA